MYQYRNNSKRSNRFSLLGYILAILGHASLKFRKNKEKGSTIRLIKKCKTFGRDIIPHFYLELPHVCLDVCLLGKVPVFLFCMSTNNFLYHCILFSFS